MDESKDIVIFVSFPTLDTFAQLQSALSLHTLNSCQVYCGILDQTVDKDGETELEWNEEAIRSTVLESHATHHPKCVNLKYLVLLKC